ncbi:MAG TPA: protein kinase, partial [Thermoanaerobaculia bacterium]|nr:protein kinase [Thermoanaerobaculia bacterium]
MTSPNPTQLGRYEIVGEIGRGAMGLVYLAQDPLIGRLVAIKTLRTEKIPSDQRDAFHERFLREAQSAGILTHPNIVTIHDVVDDGGGGVPFIAMEYVRGGNLRDLLKSGKPLPLDFVVAVVEQISAALDYAHSMGVVHRDVKPANIMITGEERVKITDFGIAQLHSGSLTHEGEMVGTPNYMAPEQVLGREVDWRADIFSLGVLVYEMLTCHKPFFGENLTSVTQRIAYEPFTPAGKWAEDLPSGIDVLLDRALHKDPSLRYQTAGALADDLRQVHENADSLNDTVATMTIPIVSSPEGSGGREGSSVLETQAVASEEAAAVRESGAGEKSRVGRSFWRQALGRPVIAAAMALTVVALLVVVAVLVRRGRSAPPTQAAVETPVHTDPRLDLAAKLAQQGQQLLDSDQAEAALVLLTQARQLDGDDPSIDSLIERAKQRVAEERRQAGEAQRQAETKGKIAGLMISAREDFGAGRFAAAEHAANQVLSLDPSDAEARSLRREARRELRRQRASSSARTANAGAARPAATKPPSSSTQAPASAEQGQSRVTI